VVTDIEEGMATLDLPEVTRTEVRRFNEFLRWKKFRRNFDPPQPMPQEIKDWLFGKDCQ
jgi:hypothetical protein